MNSEKIKESLLALGFKLNDRGSYWQTNAIFRNGNNQTAIQIYKDKGIWKDYVENTPWSPFARLVEITLGTNDPKEVGKYTDGNLEDSIGFNTITKSSAPKLQVEETYDLNILDRLLPHYKFYNDKGISTDILKDLKGESIFFLDGHYSHGITGRGNKDVPLLEELKTIDCNYNYSGVIIIDDARLFGTVKDEDWSDITESNILNCFNNNKIVESFFYDDRYVIFLKSSKDSIK